MKDDFVKNYFDVSNSSLKMEVSPLDLQLTEPQYSTMINAINNYNPFAPPSLALFPSLNIGQIDAAYQRATERPAWTIIPASSSFSYRIFFVRTDLQVYQIIANSAITNILDVSVVHPTYVPAMNMN
jgi:hypothetical protein